MYSTTWILLITALGVNAQCNLDKTLWCHDLRAVTRCNDAIRYCKTTDWFSSSFDMDTSDQCQRCVSALDVVTISLGQQQDLNAIKEALIQHCNGIKDPALVTECKALVTHYFPAVEHLIRAVVSPKVVCGLLRMCQKSVISNENAQLQVLLSSEADGVECSQCKQFFAEVQTRMKNTLTQNELQQLISTEICSTSADTSNDECNQLIARSLPQELKILADLFDPDKTCRAASCCQQARGQCLTEQQTINYGFLCTSLTSQIHQSKPTIGVYLHTEICNRLTTSRDQCSLAVDRISHLFSSKLFTIMKLGMNCQDVVTTSLNNNNNNMIAVKKPMVNICSTCRFIVDKLSHFLPKTASHEDKVLSLNKICQSLPAGSQLRDDCTQLITSNRLNISDLTSETTSSICHRLGCD